MVMELSFIGDPSLVIVSHLYIQATHVSGAAKQTYRHKQNTNTHRQLNGHRIGKTMGFLVTRCVCVYVCAYEDCVSAFLCMCVFAISLSLTQ